MESFIDILKNILLFLLIYSILWCKFWTIVLHAFSRYSLFDIVIILWKAISLDILLTFYFLIYDFVPHHFSPNQYDSHLFPICLNSYCLNLFDFSCWCSLCTYIINDLICFFIGKINLTMVLFHLAFGVQICGKWGYVSVYSYWLPRNWFFRNFYLQLVIIDTLLTVHVYQLVNDHLFLFIFISVTRWKNIRISIIFTLIFLKLFCLVQSCFINFFYKFFLYHFLLFSIKFFFLYFFDNLLFQLNSIDFYCNFLMFSF